MRPIHRCGPSATVNPLCLTIGLLSSGLRAQATGSEPFISRVRSQIQCQQGQASSTPRAAGSLPSRVCMAYRLNYTTRSNRAGDPCAAIDVAGSTICSGKMRARRLKRLELFQVGIAPALWLARCGGNVTTTGASANAARKASGCLIVTALHSSDPRFFS